MATFIGIVSVPASSSSSMFRNMKKDLRKNRNQRLFEVNCVSTFSDPYTTLRIQKGASESQVKKAFRQLALQYHPDVCRENNCEVQFYKINEAYDEVMSRLREEEEEEVWNNVPSADDDMWEEWMGWEGAGIRDYTSHINPYI